MTQDSIGIVGGGQLGRMLLQAGSPWNINFQVIDPDSEAPCSQMAHQFVKGNLMDSQAVYNFGKNSQIITIEIENVNTQALADLAQEGKKVFPQPFVIQIIQDKILQKQFYAKHNITTAPFFVVENASQMTEHTDFLPFVQKLAKEGYDGRGVQIIQTTKDFEKAFDKPSVLEKKIDIAKEIAVIAVRNEQKEISFFPIVEMVFNPLYNLVDYVFSPAQISQTLQKEAIAIAQQVVESFDLIGILAIEMFIDQQNKIWVNEVAPRPHNSGHHTIEGCFTSQFEQHLRALLGLPLGSTALRSPFAGMLNLIGEEGHTGVPYYQNIDKILALEGVFVHLYGKKITKPSRKMGHITILAQTLEELAQKISFIKSEVRVISLE